MTQSVTNRLLRLSASTRGSSSGIARVATSSMKCLASQSRNEQTIFCEPSLKARPKPSLDRTSNGLAARRLWFISSCATRPSRLRPLSSNVGRRLIELVLAGLRDLSINVIATVGREIDPAEFGPQPANIQIARYIPQSAVLPHCAAVVSHGGSGSVTGALAHGLPMVVIPMGADQPLNAARCHDLGVARVLDAVEATPGTVRDAVSTVLT